MRNWLKTVLFLSAFSPVLISLSYVRFIKDGISDYVISIFVVGCIGSLLPIMILSLAVKNAEQFTFEAKKVEANDFMLLAFIGSYLFPIIAKASDLTLSVTVFLVVGIAVILWSIGSIPAHPILRLIQFRFYKVESNTGMVYTLISKREIRDPRSIKCVKQISSSMLMEVYK